MTLDDLVGIPHDYTYTIALGNPWDGMSLYGLFMDFHEAEQFAFSEFDGQDWWIKEIEPVKFD